MNRVEFQNVTFGYEKTPVLRELSLTVQTGSFWAIVGPNGSGKTTFLRMLDGQLKPQAGEILVEGRPLSSWSFRQRAEKMSLVRQEFVPVFGYSVFETVLMARSFRREWSLFENAVDRSIAKAALAATDTLKFADRTLGQISGGERQRVFLARALAQETPMLLLDEPTSHLDLKHQIRIFDLLRQMQIEQGKTILLVTHDLNLACQYCDRVLLLGTDGAYIQGTPQTVLNCRQIEEIFEIKVFQGTVRREKFFVPLGHYSKDAPPK
ncbi:MAG: ABC transporter ATP-binding protein [Planctomycetales bacterium]|nr:ABC transporter ATP-binding protein [Planctomycetales bacterium]